MIHSKMMYIISKDDYDHLKSQAGKSGHSEDVELAKRNEVMIENKVLQQQQSDKNWQKYGDKLSQVIKQGVDASNLANLQSPVVNTTISSPPDAQSQSETSFIRLGTSAKYVNKIARLYYLLKEVADISIDNQFIYLDGHPVGPSLEIMKNLTSTNKTLKYPVESLLFKLGSYPHIVALITNKAAQDFFKKTFLRPSASSTPRKRAEKSMGEDSFLSAEEDTYVDPNQLGELFLEPNQEENQLQGAAGPRVGLGTRPGHFKLEPRGKTGFVIKKKKKKRPKLNWKSLF